MSKEIIDQFAELLVRHVRDVAIHNCDLQLRPGVKSLVARRWRASSGRKGKVPPEVMIPDCVDQAMATLLIAIDQGLLHLSFTNANGDRVDLTEDGLGELTGWYMGSGGWRAMYSKERYIDDYADLDTT